MAILFPQIQFAAGHPWLSVALSLCVDPISLSYEEQLPPDQVQHCVAGGVLKAALWCVFALEHEPKISLTEKVTVG